MIAEDLLTDLKKKVGEISNIKEFCTDHSFKIYIIYSGNQKYLLKVYTLFQNVSPTRNRRIDIVLEKETINSLHNLLPMLFPKCIHWSEGKYYIVLSHSSNVKETVWSMFYNYKATDKVCEKIGEMLGKVHSTLRSSGIVISDSDIIQQNVLQSLYNPTIPIFNKFITRMQNSSSELILGTPSPKNIGITESGSLIFLDAGCVHKGNALIDIGYICGYLMILSNLSIQKAKTFLSNFFNGYNKYSSFDLENKDFNIAVLGAMLHELELDKPEQEGNLPIVVKNNKDKIIENILSILEKTPNNLQSFINSVLGTGGINYGKLDGKIISSKQIIYHKREGPEFSINLTNKCPCSCIFCIRDFSLGWYRENPSGEMVNLYLSSEPTLEEIINAVRQELSDRKEEHLLVKFCGYGEPVLRMDIILEVTKIIKEIKPNSVVQINTSGWPLLKYFGEEFLGTLKAAGVDTLSVSLNAPSKELYNQICRPGGFKYEEDAFEKTLECIELAMKYEFKVKVTIVDIPRIHSLIDECRRLAEKRGAEFIVRDFVGRLAEFDKDGKTPVEIETKVLKIDREEIIKRLKNLGADHILSGVTCIWHYDIPDDKREREKILELIQKNLPEFRRYFSILQIITECIRNNTNLYQRRGFLRIRSESTKVALIYKEPEQITKTIKKEKEYYYDIESEQFGISLMEEWHLVLTRYIEKNRESYLLDGVIYDVDTWPRLVTYIEVEAPDEVLIFQGLLKIGLSPNDTTGVHTEDLFIKEGIKPEYLTFTDDERRRLGIRK